MTPDSSEQLAVFIYLVISALLTWGVKEDFLEMDFEG